MEKDEVWHTGEELAAQYLTRLGWTILARNWRCSVGELDIIASEPAVPGEPDAIVICEVKSRQGTGFGLPVEAINRAKVAKLREVALHWLQAQDHPVGPLRFDALGVLWSPSGEISIDHRREIC